MSIIHLQTTIKAPIGICFDLSRSVELHIISTAHTKETVIAGKLSGLCRTGDVVTWRARHFGLYQKLTVQITDCIYPAYFEDRMLNGAFKSFIHKHYFKESGDDTIMEDAFEYEVPYGIIGKLFGKVILYDYMRQLLIKRNETIRQFEESGEWEKVLAVNKVS